MVLRSCLAVVALALALTPAARAESLRASVEPSRTRGAAPLAVFFDATATRCDGDCNAFLDLHYAWDFGDPGSGTWAIGGHSRNAAYGPTAAHVFEQAGTYTVMLQVTRAGGETQKRTLQIEVASADASWPGRQTVCLSTGRDFTGCPSGARQVTAATLDAIEDECAPGQRCLLRRGDRFAGGKLEVGGRGPGLLGAFGSGPKPKLVATRSPAVDFSERTQDWRIVDLELAGFSSKDSIMFNTYHAPQQLLFLRTENAPGTFHAGLVLSQHQFSRRKQGLPESVFVVDNEWRDFGFGAAGNIIYMCARRLAILGNRLDDAMGGEHVIRITHGEGGVVSNNELSRQNRGKGLLTIRSHDQNNDCTAGCGRPTRDFVVSDNVFRTRDDYTLDMVGKNSPKEVARGENFIVERNFFTKAAGGDEGPQMAATFHGSATNVAVRNNVVVMDGWQAHRGLESSAHNVVMTNNTCYSPTKNVQVSCVKLKRDGLAYNNVLYVPNAKGRVASGATGPSAGNVLLESGRFAKTPASPFASMDEGEAASFAPGRGSPLIDKGAPVWNPLDYAGRARPAGKAPDIGAFETGTGD